MDWRVIETAGKYAGLAGIALIVLLYIVRQVLKLPVFAKIGSKGTFLTMNNVINKVFWITIISLLAWLTFALFGRPGQQNSSKLSIVEGNAADASVQVATIPCEAGAASNRCRDEYLAGRLPQARVACMRAIACAPKEADNYLRIAKIDYKEGGQLEHALKYVTDAIDRDPTNCDSYYIKAKIVVGLNRPDDALREANIAITKCHTLTSAYYVRGKIYAQKAETKDDNDAEQWTFWDKAIEDLKMSGAEGKDDLIDTCEHYSKRAQSSDRSESIAAVKSCPMATN